MCSKQVPPVNSKRHFRAFHICKWINVFGDIHGYFVIECSSHVDYFRELIKSFGMAMNEGIPPKYVDKFDHDVRKAIWMNVSQSDPEDPNKFYCFGIKRNPLKDSGEISKRSEFNSTKTHKLRPTLYNFFCKDKSISFYILIKKFAS